MVAAKLSLAGSVVVVQQAQIWPGVRAEAGAGELLAELEGEEGPPLDEKQEKALVAKEKQLPVKLYRQHPVSGRSFSSLYWACQHPLVSAGAAEAEKNPVKTTRGLFASDCEFAVTAGK